MNILRKQLTLFLDDHYATEIEKIRKKYNPVQFNLIRSHVTLCREEELENLDQVKLNLSSLDVDSMKINFDHLIRFSQQNGVMISSKTNNHEFNHLRQLVLKGCNAEINHSEPHITLMHPRNSICTDEIFKDIRKVKIPESVIFKEISLIQQVDGNKWKILETFQMKK